MRRHPETHRNRHRSRPVLVRRSLTLLAGLALAAATACGPSQRELDRRMAAVRTELGATLSGEELTPAARREIVGSRGWKALQTFYGGEEAATVWVDGEGPRESVDELITLLGAAGAGGQESEAEAPPAADVETVDAYGVERLAELRDGARAAVEEETPDMARRLADLELAAGYAFLIRAIHTIEGRVDPERLNVEWYTEGRKAEPLELLARVRDGASPSEVLDGLEPRHEAYRRLLEARERYRALVAAGGWPAVPETGEALEEGARGARVVALRKRLAVEGDLAEDGGSTEAGTRFDAELADAVSRFQERHGLEPDGTVGSDTLAALNVPVEARLRAIELNLERWRWMPGDLGDHYVEVNIPEYRLRVMRDGEPQLAMNVIVGKRLNQTPVFSDTMTYLVFNPDWNIPESIARAEVVPKLLADPGYASREGIEVVAPDGESLPPGAVLGRRVPSVSDGAAADGAEPEEPGEPERGFFARIFGRDVDPPAAGDEIASEESTVVTSLPEGYRLRQAPGPQNPLGDVKFMFPNEHNIYLHDTPAGNLFERADRGFSHGCIRLERPFELAQYVLQGSGDWSPERIRQTVASEQKTDVPLPQEIPVHLTYFTAWVDDDGRIHFRADLYGHDRSLDEALAAEEPLTLDPAALRGEAG